MVGVMPQLVIEVEVVSARKVLDNGAVRLLESSVVVVTQDLYWCRAGAGARRPACVICYATELDGFRHSNCSVAVQITIDNTGTGKLNCELATLTRTLPTYPPTRLLVSHDELNPEF